VSHKPVSPVLYVAIFFALLGLTLLTFGVAFVDLGPWHVPAAIGIALVKAGLVVLFFMHLIHSPKLTWLAMGAGLFTLAIFFGLMLADYQTRSWLPQKSQPAPGLGYPSHNPPPAPETHYQN
jgi:cytochrome c oxidase subunit 4